MKETTTIDANIPLQMNKMPYAAELESAFNQVHRGDRRNAFNTLAKGTVDFLTKAGYNHEDLADGVAMMMEMEANRIEQERKASTFQSVRPYSMVVTQKKTSEIKEIITLMNNFLMCSEIIFCDLEQKYAYRILSMLEEKGLYRHQVKKCANRLREQTSILQMRVRDNDRMATQRCSSWIMPSKRYADEMYKESGGIACKLQIAFLRMFDMKLKLIRMDNKEIAAKMNLKHPDLLAEIFTELALTETAIELFEFCQKQIRIAGRGRLIDHTIKSMHHESVRNAVKGLLDQFISRGAEIPDFESRRAREHVKEFQSELVKNDMFEMFNAQYMALRIDYIEFYLASVRLGIEHKTVGLGLIREVWRRLGSKQAAKSFFNQLAKIPIPVDEDANTADVARAITGYEGKVKTLDRFRRLCAESKYEDPPEESDEQFQCRVLRTVARKHKGQLPDDVLSTLVKKHGSKKAVMEQLERSGFELLPTLKRVKQMKASELKAL